MRIWKWAILLLVAAGMNYVVAWYCVWQYQRVAMQMGRSTPRTAAVQDRTPPAWPMGVRPGWNAPPSACREFDQGWVLGTTAGGSPDDGDTEAHLDYFMMRIDAGWPLRSVWSGFTDEVVQKGEPPIKTHDRREMASIELPDGMRDWTINSRLPLGIRVLPFVMNTAIYACVIGGLVTTPNLARRWWRAKWGRCLRCGYPLGSAAVCSECGATVKERAA